MTPAKTFVRVGLTGFALTFLLQAPLRAQTFTGPAKCVGCHDHERQAIKWQKEEPAAQKGKAHFVTLKQLDNPKSAGWAKAIGLADPYDVKGACVKCHGTVFKGDANAGVSCESCHGPASGYMDIHQQPGSHAKSVAASMKDLKDKPQVIAKVCVDCHVVADAKLGAAGHPAGAGFDAGASLQKVVHWKTAYNFAAITAAGKAITPGGGGVKPPPPPPPTLNAGTTKSTLPPATTGTGTVTTLPPSTGGTTATTLAPKPVVASTPASPPAPWDWDQPIRELPKEYVPEPVTPPPTPSGDNVAPPPPPRRARPEPAVPPSLAEDTPIPRNLTPAVVQPAAAAPAAPVARSKAAEIAEARGKGVNLIDKMLRAGARAPNAPPPSRPAEFKGPDSELLRLQDEALALALEALRRPEK
jgi:hypothetical protein